MSLFNMWSVLRIVAGNTVVTAAVVEPHKSSKLKNTLKLDFKFDSLTVVLYSPNENVVMYTRTLVSCHVFTLKAHTV